MDTETAFTTLESVPTSLHCWQGDDVGGFEKPDASLSGGGIQATGNYPGKARTIPQLRQDLDKALSLIPGKHRLNLHACYADLDGERIDRNEYAITHFQSWVDWCNERGMGFNPSYFSHPRADDGLTLSHADPAIRKFWIEHGIVGRKIGAEAARQLGSPTVTNFWIPVGSKDTPFECTFPELRVRARRDRRGLIEVSLKVSLPGSERVVLEY